jgi:hypothetical protein
VMVTANKEGQGDAYAFIIRNHEGLASVSRTAIGTDVRGKMASYRDEDNRLPMW